MPSKPNRTRSVATTQPEVLPPAQQSGNVVLTTDLFQTLLAQVAGGKLPAGPTTGPFLKYAFEYFKIGSDLMHIFGNLKQEPFTLQTIRHVSQFAGAYFVFRGESLVYVGQSEKLRGRLTSHLNGKSNLAIAMKKKYVPNDWRRFLAENFTVHTWEQDDLLYLKQLEHVVIGVFKPPFNATVNGAA
jgi:hypothetical protein